MITSMNQCELYKTLIGHYKPNYKGNTAEPDDSTTAAAGDRFEYSGEQTTGYEISDAINFDCNNIRTEMESGYTNGIPTKERIAEYFGDIAKRLDTAYAEGKFTKEEYDELNVYLEEQLERKAVLTERREAFYAWGRSRGSLSPQKAGEVIRHQQSITPEQWREERDSIIDELVEKYYRIDRTLLLEMFNAVRYGKNNI